MARLVLAYTHILKECVWKYKNFIFNFGKHLDRGQGLKIAVAPIVVVVVVAGAAVAVGP